MHPNHIVGSSRFGIGLHPCMSAGHTFDLDFCIFSEVPLLSASRTRVTKVCPIQFCPLADESVPYLGQLHLLFRQVGLNGERNWLALADSKCERGFEEPREKLRFFLVRFFFFCYYGKRWSFRCSLGRVRLVVQCYRLGSSISAVRDELSSEVIAGLSPRLFSLHL